MIQRLDKGTVIYVPDGMPFAFSFGSIVKSNSVLDAPVVPEQAFPVILYSHGYSGFTSVYQTVFEALDASSLS